MNNLLFQRIQWRERWKSINGMGTATMFFFFVLIFVIQWHRLFLGNEIPVDGNTFRFFYPSWAIGKRLMLGGQSLLWDPYRNMGQPFLAHPQNQALYPIRLFLLPFDFLNYVRFFLIFHYFILAFFTHQLIRFWGYDRSSAFVATAMMILGGFLVARIPDQSDVASFCWIPAVLYFFSKQKPMALGLVLLMQWLSGFPPFFILTFLLLFFVGVCGSDRRKNFIRLGQATFLFLGLAAVQWIPFMEFLINSTRPVFFDSKDLLQYSLHPLELLRGCIIPAIFHPYFPLMENSDPAVVGFFLGPIQMILFFTGLSGSQRRLKKLGLVAALGAFMALGKYNGVYASLPFVGLFRFPAQWIIWLVLCVPLVAADGFSKIKSVPLKWGVFILLLFDGISYSWTLQSPWIGSDFSKFDPLRIVESVPTNGPRVLHSPPLFAQSYRWKISGSQSWINFLAIKPPSMLAAEGIREVFSHTNLQSPANRILQEKIARVSFDSPLLNEAGVALTVCLRPGADTLHPPIPGDVGLKLNAHPKSHAFIAEGHPSTVLIDRPGRMIVRAEGPGHLVFSESYFPGWKAKVDGQKSKILPFEDVFLSVPLEGGEHQVDFAYHPNSFLVGLWISILTGMGIIGYQTSLMFSRSKNLLVRKRLTV
jgi:hypothetical protein